MSIIFSVRAIIKTILVSSFLFAGASQGELLVNDKVIFSPDNDANFWGYQIKTQNDRMLVSNYAAIDGFGLAGSVDYYQINNENEWIFQQRIEPPMFLFHPRQHQSHLNHPGEGV